MSFVETFAQCSAGANVYVAGCERELSAAVHHDDVAKLLLALVPVVMPTEQSECAGGGAARVGTDECALRRSQCSAGRGDELHVIFASACRRTCNVCGAADIDPRATAGGPAVFDHEDPDDAEREIRVECTYALIWLVFSDADSRLSCSAHLHCRSQSTVM